MNAHCFVTSFGNEISLTPVVSDFQAVSDKLKSCNKEAYFMVKALSCLVVFLYSHTIFLPAYTTTVRQKKTRKV